MERTRASAWKETTSTLPAPAKVAAPYIGKDGQPTAAVYDHCLPPEYAALSLLPDVRVQALDLFAELGIPCHAGVGPGPSNNLLSSQVQCVNALARMVTDPDRLIRTFSERLGTVEALQIEPGRYLTFEFIGPTDYFGEARRGRRIRGAECTSVDAAFLHRTGDGETELVLVEWKYTERYRTRAAHPRTDAVRRRRYGYTFEDPAGPLRTDLVSLDVLFQEPFYQLVRQQLMAYRLEAAGVLGCDRVRVVNFVPLANTAYQHSVHHPDLLELGSSVSAVWARLLRRPDRFVSLDPAVFLDHSVTSGEYTRRYGDQP